MAGERAQTAPTSVRWNRLAVLVLLLAFAIRVVSIQTTYMRDDEEIAFRTTARGLNYAVWYQAEQDVHAPVWFMSFWAWQQAAGTNEFTARIFSILLSLLSLALLYQVGRRWFGHPVYGIFAVAVAAVNAYTHIYALEIRPYALGMLLALANMLLFRRWLVRPVWRRALVYGASVSLLLWTHYFLIFLVLAQVLYIVLKPSPAVRVAGGAGERHRYSAWLKLRLVQGLGAAGVALLLWLPWLPVFIGQVETLRQLEQATGAFRGLGIGNTTQTTTPETVWRLILLMTNGQPLLYALPVLAGLVLVRRRDMFALALAWALAVPALNLLVNLIASVYTPRYLSYVGLGVALAVGVGLASVPRFRWAVLVFFCVVSLWAMPSQYATDRVPLRDIFQRVSALAEPGDAVYFTRADDADLFTRWQIDHYLAAELRDRELDEFEDALAARAVWFITGDFFAEAVQTRFRQLEATHPLHAVVGDCNRHWCYLAQRLVGPPEPEPVRFGENLLFHGVDPVTVDGGGLTARLWWSVAQPLALDYSISLQLLDASGMLVAQRDGSLNPDSDLPIQTSQLDPQRVYVDDRTLVPGVPLTTGTYQLTLVVYQPWDNVRLTLQDGLDTLSLRDITLP